MYLLIPENRGVQQTKNIVQFSNINLKQKSSQSHLLLVFIPDDNGVSGDGIIHKMWIYTKPNHKYLCIVLLTRFYTLSSTLPLAMKLLSLCDLSVATFAFLQQLSKLDIQCLVGVQVTQSISFWKDYWLPLVSPIHVILHKQQGPIEKMSVNNWLFGLLFSAYLVGVFVVLNSKQRLCLQLDK